MTLYSPIPAAVAAVLAFVCAWFLSKRFGAPPATGRFATIDGLRGYLALGVFLHHVALWRVFVATNAWTSPASRFYERLGSMSVGAFFMITAFLFVGKLAHASPEPIPWARLYISRVLRLWPAYLAVATVVFVVAMSLSGWHFNVSPRAFASGVADWLLFNWRGKDINGYPQTFIIIAGVLWTLRFEWTFYLSLPVIALVLNRHRNYLGVFVGICFIGFCAASRPPLYQVLPFVLGAAVPWLVRNALFVEFSKKSWGSAAAGACLVACLVMPSGPFGLAPVVVLGVAFALIAAGSSIFGMLTHDASRALGEWTYSIYLWHGIVLFAAFDLIVGKSNVSDLSVGRYWALGLALIPVLIALSFASYRFIEHPALANTDRVTSWWLRRLSRDYGSNRAISAP